MSTRIQLFLIALLVSTALIVVIFAAVGFITRDPHWLQRGGAFIAAYAAGIGFVTFVLEIRFEDMQHKLDAASERATNVPSSSPLGRLANRLNMRKVGRQRSELRKERLYLAATVAICLLFGELFHGFGDLVLKLLFRQHFSH